MPIVCYGTHVDNKTVCSKCVGEEESWGSEREGIHCASKLHHPYGIWYVGKSELFVSVFQVTGLMHDSCFREQGQTPNCVSSWYLRSWNNSSLVSSLNKGYPFAEAPLWIQGSSLSWWFACGSGWGPHDQYLPSPLPVWGIVDRLSWSMANRIKTLPCVTVH